jgi:hypothetical protein
MPLVVREADLKKDRSEITSFLYENLTRDSDAHRFDWLYLDNPSGAAKAWIALDGTRGDTVGVAAAFPRSIWVDGKRRTGWVLGDFCISSAHRTLGPALSLQRACLESINRDSETIWYDFPSSRMVAIYKRLGVPLTGSIVRYVKVLRVDSKIESVVPAVPLQRALAVVGNSALRIHNRVRGASSDINVSILPGPFGVEFSELDSCLASRQRFQGSRTADYLNWRYRQNPLRKYQVVVARRGSELVGYAVIESQGADCFVAQLEALEETEAIPALLSHIGDFAYRSKHERINVPVTERSRFDEILRRCGFYPREGAPVIVSSVENIQTWCLMHGDRES